MSHRSLWERWARGARWIWVNERYRGHLPQDFAVHVMTLDSPDRLHAKQGRSIARVTFEAQAPRSLAVYLKRHYRLPWARRWAALLHPAGRYSPAAAEWTHLERARALGIDVPEVVAAGEQIGPGAHLQSFLDLEGRDRDGRHPRVVLIDLHRLGRHPLWPAWWRCKDLGQLLFSSYGVAGIDDRDRHRFWRCYRRITHPRAARWQARLIRFRAARYARHNRNPR